MSQTTRLHVLFGVRCFIFCACRSFAASLPPASVKNVYCSPLDSTIVLRRHGNQKHKGNNTSNVRMSALSCICAWSISVSTSRSHTQYDGRRALHVGAALGDSQHLTNGPSSPEPIESYTPRTGKEWLNEGSVAC